MDYNLLKNAFSSLLEDNLSNIEASKKKLADITAENAFDKNILSILNNIHKTIETNESLKTLAKVILDQSDYFSDDSIHQSTKHQALKKILMTNNFVENNRSFNLSTLQAYVENILQKQLYEINIKIEENQRVLNNLSISSAQQVKSDVKKINTDKYILVENEGEKCAIRHADMIQILKFPGAFPKKNLADFTMIYAKVCGANQNYVIKKMQDTEIDKRQILGNANMTFANTVDKNFAVITKKDDEFIIFFIDYVLYTNPVEAENLGDFIQTSEGRYHIIEV
ncbi:MAG: hypothetical protein ABIJ31_14845 [Pseudomonadota bacterium]